MQRDARDGEAVHPGRALERMLYGGVVAMTVAAAARLGLADALRDGPRSVDELARDLPADAPTLARVLRALAAFGVLARVDAGRYALTPVGEYLRSDVPGSLHGAATFLSHELALAPIARLADSVRDGRPAFEAVFGAPLFDYLAAHPHAAEVFDRRSTGSAARAIAALVSGYDFGRFAHIADIGGGRGALLAGVLRAHPGLRGTLCDLPHAIAGARVDLEEAGVLERCTLVEGSFFDAVPAGADLYVLKSILHDWDDEAAGALLAACARAMRPGATLIVVERVLSAAGDVTPDEATLDVAMLLMTSGRERTEAEYVALLTSAGLAHARTLLVAPGVGVIEAIRP